MFATKKKLAALEQESERLKEELSQQAGAMQAAYELLSLIEPDEALDNTLAEERLLAAREDLCRLDRRCVDDGEASGSGKPLLARVEDKLASCDRRVREIERLHEQVESLSEALETSLGALPEQALVGMVKSHPVYEHWEEADGKAWVTTAFCQLGGCEYRGREFDAYRDALAFAIVREATGKEVETSGACPECYAEYMRDCV